MRLSNKSTFSLVFSVLLIAGFAFVAPLAMAAEGGPTIVSIELDETQTTGGDLDTDPMTDDVPKKDVVSGGNALLTNALRTDLVDLTGGAAGYFRLIVTFSEDVYEANTARPGEDNENTRTLSATDLGIGDFTIIGVGRISDGMPIISHGVNIDAVTRVVTSAAEVTPVTYSPRKFLVTIEVPSSRFATDLPIAIALNVDVDVLFGIGISAGVVNGLFQVDTPGLGNVVSEQFDFTVAPRPISTLIVGGKPARAIRSHEQISLTLTFNPALNDADIPTRTNIIITGGDFKSDDLTTLDMDEGLHKTSTDNTVWQLVIVPAGGIGDTGTITVKNAAGTAFILNETFQVNNLPDAQRVDITSDPSPVPAAGAIFTVNIVYTVAPATDLTVAGVTVENGDIVAGSFSGSGTTYSVRIDPNNPAADAPVTVTVRVGQDFATFTTSVTTDTGPVAPDDPHTATSFTLTAGLDSREYLVITPAMIDLTSDPMVNADVLPAVLTDRETQATMPDLENILFGGGTVDVYVDVETNTPDIIISEVMWAVDEAEVGTEGYTAHQWVEIYNNSDNNATPGSITLWFKPRTLSGAPTDKGARTDRLSNVLRFGTTTGWRLGENHGQSGNSNSETPKEFISMYRKGDKLGDNDGINGAHWIESTLLSHVNHRGTPGAANTRAQALVSTRPEPSVFNPPKGNVIINEVYNDADNKFDWIELRFLKKTNLENWTLSYTQSNFSEHEIMRFPKREFAEGTILLIVNADPRDTNLAAGQDVTEAAENQARGAGPHKYWNPSNGDRGSNHYLDIPKKAGDDPDGDFLLILRTGKGWERFGSRDRIHDVVGTGTHERKTLNSNTVAREPNTENPNDGKKGYIWNTRVWPLNGHHDIRDAHKDHGYSLLANDRNLAEGKVWRRNGTNQGWQRDGGAHIGFQGGLGYDRGYKGNGTPGYDNGPVKGRTTELDGGRLVISELMLTTDNGRFPQFIELHNTSKTKVVNLASDGSDPKNGWQMIVENHNSGSWKDKNRPLNITFNLKDGDADLILPDQTILIAADKVRSSTTSAGVSHFPDYRIISIWEKAKDKFKMASRRDAFLNAEGGFYIKIVDGDGRVADEIGNLDGKAASVRNDIPLDDPYSWNWSTEMEDNRRTSLIRIRDEDASGDNVPRAGVPDRTVDGDMTGAVIPLGTRWRGAGKDGTGEYAKYDKHAWVHASDTKMANAQITWYGSDSDYGTPGHTTSTPLPVSLSFFRPTLEEGKVVIRWTTESELDNAGFNIYRSESRHGEFKMVNDKLIQGKGTTAERSTYKWVDTSAKPGAVYYYQIEDVSFAGERKTLRTTKMKGLISAQNKLTTKWGELKEVQ